ncbi:MAG: hypothetical protein WC952_07935 [Desulfobulbaceae bacterium]|jgi:hypothetical protein
MAEKPVDRAAPRFPFIVYETGVRMQCIWAEENSECGMGNANEQDVRFAARSKVGLNRRIDTFPGSTGYRI